MPVSFPIPLANALGEPEVHYVNEEGTEEVTFDQTSSEWVRTSTADCPGDAAAPRAKPGNLCVYQASAEGLETLPEQSGGIAEVRIRPATTPVFSLTLGASTSGAVVNMSRESTDEPTAYGTWAVTAP